MFSTDGALNVNSLSLIIGSNCVKTQRVVKELLKYDALEIAEKHKRGSTYRIAENSVTTSLRGVYVSAQLGNTAEEPNDG